MHDVLEIKRGRGLDPSDGAYPPRQIPEFKRGVGRNNERLEGGLWGIRWPSELSCGCPCYPPCVAPKIKREGHLSAGGVLCDPQEILVPFVR